MEGYTLDPNMLVNALASKDNDGISGNNGLLWIFLLILFGGGGFGGWGYGNRAAGALINDASIAGQIEAALAKAQAAGLSDSTILTAIGGNKESINSLAAYTATNFSQVDSALRGLERGLCDLGYRMGQDTASVMAAISQGDAALSRQLSECCCNTQRAIDSVNYNMATNFGALTNNIDKGLCALSHQVDSKIDMAQMENRAGFQSIRDMFTADKIANLQRELEISQFQNSQQAQTQVLKDYVASYFGCPPGVINCNQQ